MNGSDLVLVTGAAGDVGAEVVTQLVAGGIRVMAADNRMDDLAQDLSGTPGAVAVALDLNDDSSIRRVAAAVRERWEADAPRTFGLVHCAGVAQVAPFAESDPDGWDLMYRVNQRGPLLLTQALLPVLMGGSSSVVFVGSDSARAGAGQEVVYAATKAAQMGAAKSLARELARHGSRVNVVSPGPIAGRMSQSATQEDTAYLEKLRRTIPMRRLASPENVASVITWLLGPHSAYVTGQTISVSGGITMQ